MKILCSIGILLSVVILYASEWKFEWHGNVAFDGTKALSQGILKSLPSDNGLTVIAWMRAQLLPQGSYAGTVVKLNTSGELEWGLYQAGWNDRYGFYVKTNKGDAFLHTDPGVIAGKTHVVAGVFQPDSIALWVDGKQKAQAKRDNNRLITSSGALLIGALRPDSGFFKGTVEQILVFNRALTEAELQQFQVQSNLKPTIEVVAEPRPILPDKPQWTSLPETETLANFQVVDWRVSPQATDNEIAQLVGRVADAGFDAMFLAGSFRYMFAEAYGPDNWWSAIPWKVYIDRIEVIARECHRRQLKFVPHLTVNLILDDDYARFQGMAIRDVSNNKEIHWPEYSGYNLCPNQPEFQQRLAKRLRELYAATQFDGLMIDEITFAPSERSCGCEYCRKLFRAEYGEEIPTPEQKNIWNNYDSETWRNWMSFRRDSITRHAGRIRALLDEFGPEKILTGCSYNPSEAHIIRMYGYDVFSIPYTLQFFENEPFHPWSWRHGAAEGKWLGADQRPVIAQGYALSLSQEYFQNTLATTMNWGSQQWVEFNNYRHLDMNWQKYWKPLWFGKESIKEIAIVIAPEDNLLTASNHSIHGNASGVPKEYFGWAEMLLEEHRQFDVITTSNLKALNGYRLVILPNTMCLSDDAVNQLNDFVFRGGAMIVSGKSGYFDQTGQRRNKLPWINSKHPLQVVTDSPGEQYYMPKVGAGWSGVGAAWLDERKPEAAKKMRNAISLLLQPVIKSNHLPAEVIVNAHLQKYEENSGIVIQLFNLLGTRFDNEVLVPADLKYEFIEYPALKSFLPAGKEVTFELDYPAKEAYLLSPDYEAIVRLPVSTANNKCRVVLPDLERYAVIYLPLTGNLITKLTGDIPMTETIPTALKFTIKSLEALDKK